MELLLFITKDYACLRLLEFKIKIIFDFYKLYNILLEIHKHVFEITKNFCFSHRIA